MNLIAITGKAGSGKDTVGAFINKRLGGNYEIKKFADKLKEVAGLMLGVPVDQFENRVFKHDNLGPEWGYMSVREFLQKLGTDAVRNNLFIDAWVNILFESYTPSKKWIITDCRMLNEAARVQQYGGKVVKVVRSGIESGNHQSETELDCITPDYIIYNDGSFFDLEIAVDKMINHFQNEDRNNDKARA